MALRSVWAGGVCNFTLVTKKRKTHTHTQKEAFQTKKTEKPCNGSARLCLTCMCVHVWVEQGLIEMSVTS